MKKDWRLDNFKSRGTKDVRRTVRFGVQNGLQEEIAMVDYIPNVSGPLLMRRHSGGIDLKPYMFVCTP